MLLLQQSTASLQGHQQRVARRNLAPATAPWPNSCFYPGWGRGGYFCANQPCPANVTTATWMLSGLLPSGILALPRATPTCLAAGSSGLWALLRGQGTWRAAWQPAEKRGVHLPTAARFPPSWGTPRVPSGALTETRSAARSLCSSPQLLQPHAAAARAPPGRGPAASGLKARVPRPLSPNGSPRGRRRPASQGCRWRARGPPAHLPRGVPPPSDLAGHGRALGTASPPLPPRRRSPAPGGGANSGRRDAPVRSASPQPPLPSACLLLWSLGLMN